MLKDFDGAERLAAETRSRLGVDDGPLIELGRVVERLGLHAFVFEFERAADGAYVSVSSSGVAVINGSMPSGRRRFTLAHELGHHLLADAYSTDYLDEGSGTLEGLINAFAAYLLMPRRSVNELWRERRGEQDPRTASIVLAAHYRVSWTAACSHLRNLDLVDDRLRRVLTAEPPRQSDYIELDLRLTEELGPTWVPPRYAAAVIRLYRRNKISSARTLELMYGTLDENELPIPRDIPRDAFRYDVQDDR